MHFVLKMTLIKLSNFKYFMTLRHAVVASFADHCLSGREDGGRAKNFRLFNLSMYSFISFLRSQKATTNLDDKSLPIVNIFDQYHLQIQ